jgi:hypothetical protein
MLRQGQNLLASLGKLQDEISELQQLSLRQK